MPGKATDLVLSYIVEDGKVDDASYRPLKQALEDGYRVVDIIIPPAPAVGVAAPTHACAIVTVLLSLPNSGSLYCAGGATGRRHA